MRNCSCCITAILTLLNTYKKELAEYLEGFDVEMIAECEGKVEAVEECILLLYTTKGEE